MKNLNIILCGIMAVLTLTSFTAKESVNEYPEKTVTFGNDTPNRIGTRGVAYGELVFAYRLEEAIIESGLVVDATIIEWLKEDDYMSFFKAQINYTFKGENFDEIILLQEGNSEVTYKDYPLYSNGDRLFLFLKKTTGEDYEKSFHVIGAWTTVMEVKESNGELYLIDRFGYMTDKIESSVVPNNGAQIEFSQDEVMSPFYESKKELKQEYLSQFYQDDPVFSDYDFVRSRIYSYNEIVNNFF